MSGDLERRYRGLLAWYPTAYRAEYGEEMLGVLLDGARDGQRYPKPAEAADLIRSALALRLGRGVPGVTDPRWPAAGAMFGLLGALAAVAHLVGGRVTRYASGELLYQDGIGAASLVFRCSRRLGTTEAEEGP